MDKFKPWPGSKYATSNPRIMLMGESFYFPYGKPNNKEDVAKYIMEGSGGIEHGVLNVVKGKWGQTRFFGRIYSAMTDQRVSELNGDTNKWQDFWNQYLYYNYLQTDELQDSRQFPWGRTDIFEKSFNCFWDVLREHKPQLIILFGKRSAWRLFYHQKQDENFSWKDKGDWKVILNQPYSVPTITCCHPSSQRFKFNEEHKRIMGFINSADFKNHFLADIQR